KFKGRFSATKISVIMEGGQVGNEMVMAEPGIQLSIGEAGMFFLAPTNHKISKATGTAVNYDLYSAAQGFIRYDVTDRIAHDPFATYNDIVAELYPMVLQYSGRQSFIEVKPIDFFKHKHNDPSAAPVISSFSPTSTYAGTLSANV